LEDVTINAYDIKLVLKWFSQFMGSRLDEMVLVSKAPKVLETRKKLKYVVGDFQTNVVGLYYDG